MKKTPKKQQSKAVASAPFTNADATRFFGSIKEHFDDRFKVIHERIDLFEERTDHRFDGIDAKLNEHHKS